MLSYRLICDVALVEPDEPMGTGLGVAVRGQFVPWARLAVIRLTNEGRRPAMVHGIRVEIDPPAVLGSAIDHAEPANLIPDEALAGLVRLQGAGAVELRDLFLNGQESIWMTVLTATPTQVRAVRHASGQQVPREIDLARHMVAIMTVLAIAAGLLVGSVLWLLAAAWLGSSWGCSSSAGATRASAQGSA